MGHSTQLSFTSVLPGEVKELSEGRLPGFSALFYPFASPWCVPLFSASVWFSLFIWFAFWIMFVLLRFSGVGFKSSSPDFESIWDFIWVTQTIAAGGG